MKKLIFIVIINILVASIFLVFLLTIDLYYHNRYFTKFIGLNYRGYRSEVLGNKKPGEKRIAMFGGSVLLGYGVKWWQSIPAQLEKKMRLRNPNMRVINLAYNNEGAYAYYYNLQDFYYLDYDYVIFFTGYNDMGIGNTTLYRHKNPIFRLTGYMPILPLIISEKIMVLKSNGDLEGAYWKRVVFNPKPKDKLAISTLQTVLESYNKMEEIMNRIKKIEKPDFDVSLLKSDTWAWYKFFMQKSIKFALSHNKKVIVINEPYLSPENKEQQNALKTMIQKEYGDKVKYIDMGPLTDNSLTFDGMHYNEKGCDKMAEIIAEKIKDEL